MIGEEEDLKFGERREFGGFIVRSGIHCWVKSEMQRFHDLSVWRRRRGRWGRN